MTQNQSLSILGQIAPSTTGTAGQILTSNGSSNSYWTTVPNFNYNFLYSAQFNGSSSYLTVAANAALQMGTGDFTVEFWINTTDTNAGIYGTASSTSQFNIAFNGTSLVYQSSWGVTNLYFVPLSNLCNGSWHHVAIVRASGVQKVFYDGVVQSLSSGTFTDATNYSGAGNWNIGYDGPSGGNQGYLAGYISNFRVVKGVAVYTGAFTVPSSPLQISQAAGTNIAAVASSQVSLLTCNALTLTDSSPNALAITNTGGVVVSTTTVPTFTAYNNATARTQTQTILTSGSGTYNTPFGVAWLRIRMVGGGGGGGAGSGASAGTAGSNTTFGSSFLTAAGGGGGIQGNGTVGAGGTASIGSGATGTALTGGGGNPGIYMTAYPAGGNGGTSPFGGAGAGGNPSGSNVNGGAGITNSGSGGGGGNWASSSTTSGGSGGGAGGYVEAYISSPAASYAYIIGTGGGGGAGSGGAAAGGGGGSGVIIIEENYPVTGQIPTNASGTTQQFTANGTGSSFTLSSSINTSDAIVSHNGLTLPPTVDYTVLGTSLNLTFTPANTDLIEVRTMSSSMSTVSNTITFSDATKFNTAQSLGPRNRIINGAMQIWQRGTSFTGLTTSTYAADRTYLNMGTPGTGVFGVTQSTDVPAGQGFPYSFLVQPTTAMSSLNAASYVQPCHRIEGLNVSDLMYGTSTAKTITLSYWVKTNFTATLSAAIMQVNNSKTFPWTVSVTSGVWTKVSVTIPGDTAGSISNSTAAALELNYAYLAIGSNYSAGSPTLNAWNSNASTNQYATQSYNYASSTSNTLQITGIQLEVGTVATPFEFRQYGAELALCQRYYYRIVNNNTTGYVMIGSGRIVNSTYGDVMVYMPVSMRALPTLNYSALSLFQMSGFSALTALSVETGNYSLNTVNMVPLYAAATGLTSNMVAMLQTSSNTAGWIDFSAEL
jgi:hypothetical protein